MKSGKARSAQRLSVAIAAACAAISPAWAETKFVLSSEVNATWIDNINLESNDALKQSEYVLQVNPGFVFEQTGPRINSSVSYMMRNYFYAEDSDRNSTFHEGLLDATLALVKEYFYLQGSGSYTQQVIDPKVATNNNLLFEKINVADALSAQISPYFHHEFDNFRADVRYTRGIVKYKAREESVPVTTIPLLQDVDTEARYATFGSADDLARLTWETRYEYQEARYDVSPPFRFESASAELGLLLGRSLRLIGRGGLESDPVRDSTKAGLEESHWEAGFRWRPSPRTFAQALYGVHSYGDTYSARVEHAARLFELSASYAEGPTTQAQELVLRPVAAGQQAAETVFTSGTENYNSITSDVYLREDAEGKAVLKGQRTQLELSAFHFKRNYISGSRKGAVELTRGASLGLTRSLSGGLQLEMSGKYSEAQFETSSVVVPLPVPVPAPAPLVLVPYEYHDVLLHVGLIEKLSERISVSLEGNRMRRTGGLDYTVNWLTLGIKGEF